MPTISSELICSAVAICWLPVQAPSENEPSRGADGWMYGLPKKNATPVPNSIIAMPTAMSFTRGSLQI